MPEAIFLKQVATAVLDCGVTPQEAQEMVQVLIARSNKVDNAQRVVTEVIAERAEARRKRMGWD